MPVPEVLVFLVDGPIALASMAMGARARRCKLLRDISDETIYPEHLIDTIYFVISQKPLCAAGFTSREVFETRRNSGYSSLGFDPSTDTFLGEVRDTQRCWQNYNAFWSGSVGNAGSPNEIL